MAKTPDGSRRRRRPTGAKSQHGMKVSRAGSWRKLRRTLVRTGKSTAREILSCVVRTAVDIVVRRMMPPFCNHLLFSYGCACDEKRQRYNARGESSACGKGRTRDKPESLGGTPRCLSQLPVAYRER